MENQMAAGFEFLTAIFQDLLEYFVGDVLDHRKAEYGVQTFVLNLI